MSYTKKSKLLTRPAPRIAALLCAALAGLCLAGRVDAQVTGPLVPNTSPPTPTPFQSPLYHSGGANTPYDGTAADAPYLTPLIDPIQGQLQGTPTELYNGNLTQIPSFLLGNYDPTRPPTGIVGGINTYYPNHFADGDIYSWSAPFSYVSQNAATVTLDDNSVTAAGPGVSYFTNNGFAAVTNITTYPAVGTATNGEYLRLASGVPGSVVWTLYQPTAGNYSLYFHIPNDLPDVNGNPEVRDTQVTYFIAVRDANGNVTSTTTATSSQTEANDSQYLAGPFQVQSGGTVTVTLTRSNTVNNNVDYLVADSMTLQPTVGDVESAPTAITRDLYPNDFASLTHPLQYWGIYIPPAASVPTGQQTGGTTAAVNANPDTNSSGGGGTTNSGNILLKTGSTTTALDMNGAPDPLHLVRQLVYFGRSDPAASISRSIDDSQTGFTGTGTLVNAAPTASNSEYRRSATSAGTAPMGAVATWTIPVPAGGSSYFVYVHLPALGAGEIRLNRVFYDVSVDGGTPILTTISQATQGTDALVALPTGALTPGTTVVVRMYNQNGSTVSSPTGTVVVADSVTLSTGTGQGAIYCVDGFNGQVVWRYETPGSANGASAPVFASPAVAKINVLLTPATVVGGVVTVPAVYAQRLVVIVGDNNGLVYCLDAIGNGDGTSNVNVLAKDTNNAPIPGEPVTIAQPAYGGVYGAVATPLTAGTLASTAALTSHVGTTGVYWIYRPDAARPKYVTAANGATVGAVKPIDPNSDLPVPASFATASPNIFVDPTVPTDVPTKPNAIVYLGNSNGVLYALNASGGARDSTSINDPFNASQAGFDTAIPSAQPLWWFSLRGPNPNSGDNVSAADIESAPAISVTASTTTPVTYTPTVYIGSAHEQGAASNIGRLYALNGLVGPSFNNGRTSPLTQPAPATANYTGPGSLNYNVGQIPQTGKTDTTDWSFPDANNTFNGPLAGFQAQSSNGKPRPALGNITGSPVVFTNTHETNAARRTRIYIAANSGQEYPAAARPDDTTTGRIWAVNQDGTVGTTTNSNTGTWSYPLANDPNDATLDTTAEPYAPMGAFLRGTPAIGFVQFPATITNGDSNAYNPVDAYATGGIEGQSVPMLYIGTRGVSDTALYALDLDGAMTTPVSTTTTSSGTVASDSRFIYRLVSPDGSIYQSSPALVANATSTGGNGGGVYAVAGNTLYDYSATPISNPFAGQPYPLIRENRAFVGFGPISSPALAGANVSDLPTATTFINGGTGNTISGASGNTSGYTSLTTDWVYVGDSSSGLARGITPNDASYGGIPAELGEIIPYDANAPSAVLLNAFIQTYLVTSQTSHTSADALGVGVNAPLPVREWGESVYARFTNVAPPNKPDPSTNQPDPALFVHDTVTYPDLTQASADNPIPFYTSDGTPAQTVTFKLSDVDATGATGAAPLLQDNGQVQPVIVTTPPDGFVVDPALLTASTVATPPYTTATVNVVENLVANNGNRYLGTYTYTIADGSGRNNTPGARRKFSDVQQTVTEYDYTGGDINAFASYKPKGTVVIGGDATSENLVSQKTVDPVTKAVTYGFNANSKIVAVDQPTFGILNPLGVRGGGVDLLGHTPMGNAVDVGDSLGPFRSAQSPPTLTTDASGNTTTSPGGDVFTLQALTNGNDVPTAAPPSTSGGGGSPIKPLAASDPTGITTATKPSVVVTTTGLIAHNTSGDNSEPSSGLVQGTYNNSTNDDGLAANTPFGGNALDVFDRSALFNLGQTLRLKAGVENQNLFAPPTSPDAIIWNSNVINDTTGHDSVVNYLPWEVPPTPFALGGVANSSQDYPDIAPSSLTQSARLVPNAAGSSGGDLTSNSVTLPRGIPGADPIVNRIVTGNPVQVRIAVPHYQPANQQLYQQLVGSTGYLTTGQIAPVTAAGGSNITASDNVFPMGYIAVKRLAVPNASGNYSPQRPYRDVRVYTGVPVDMRTSIGNPTTDIGKVPAAFGVQTENYTPTVDPLGYFTPYNTAFQDYFKPLEIRNDGNVNLLNVHLDQKYVSTLSGGTQTLLLNSDAVDPLSALNGYDFAPTSGTYGVTGPHTGILTPTTIQEQPYLIRSSVDTDLAYAYGRNPSITSTANNALYPGATFHKPTPGGSAPSILTVPDAPERYTAGASLSISPTPTTQIDPNTGLPYKSPPYVSLAVPFGTPVGTYATPGPQSIASLRLFEGLDSQNPNTPAYNLNTPPANATNPIPYYLYPPQYGTAVGGIGTPTAALSDTYRAGEPISDQGTQLIGTVLEQRLTDGATPGAVPMVDGGSAGGTSAAPQSTPDFAPAAFRDPATGNLSFYWTSGRGGSFSVYGSNLPFTLDPMNNTSGLGYFLPTDSTTQWWKAIGTQPVLASPTGTSNSGLSVTADRNTGNVYAFDVNVLNGPPYNNTLYGYAVTPGSGVLGQGTPVTPASDSSQVKYGVKGVYTGYTNPLWAFWTASTRGRTTIGYNAQASGGAWGTAVSRLPVPAGLTAVADPSPMLMPIMVSGAASSVIEVTYSGTGPDGNVDLYASRYQPDTTKATQLDLVQFPAVTEKLRAAPGGWYQARDVAWSSAGALNLTVRDAAGVVTPLLYNGATPLFASPIYDKASGLLVLTGVKVPIIGGGTTTNTVTVDAATGRVRFAPALLPATQNFAQILATFSPLAKRLTIDSRADSGPVLFLDDKLKPNDAPNLGSVEADRRWTVWRKSGIAADTASATLYWKAQRLTFFLPLANGIPPVIDPTKPLTITLNGTAYSGAVDVDYTRGRLYFPIASGAEGQTAVVSYTNRAGTSVTTTLDPLDTVQWQDEIQANDTDTTAPGDTVAGLDTVLDTKVPLDKAINENNVAAFLDPFASATSTHKVWLFWNSTRKGTADIYSETIDPRFAPGP